MSTSLVLIESVARGVETFEACPDCGGERVTLDLQALTAEGLICLGLLIDCTGCGAFFRCASCLVPIASSGPAVHHHILTYHGAPGRG